MRSQLTGTNPSPFRPITRHERRPDNVRATTVRATMAIAAAVLGLLTTACGRSDAQLQSELQNQLASDATMAGAHLTVTVTNGVTHISGDTDSKAQQARALEIARAVKGIETIEPDMRLNDAALVRAVKDAVAADPAVGNVPLTVEVHDGAVVLISDKTNADERERIKQLARAAGASGVEDRMK